MKRLFTLRRRLKERQLEASEVVPSHVIFLPDLILNSLFLSFFNFSHS